MRIPCPFCGLRDETEFAYGREASVKYPVDPYALEDSAWSEYLFIRSNPRGWLSERWMHRAGCRQWFTVERHTITHEFRVKAADS